MKMELLESVLGKDRSEQAETCRAHCVSSLPDPLVKARVWQEITDFTTSTDSVSVRNAKMAGFYHHEQKEMLEPYFDKFFDVLEEYEATTPTLKTLKQQNSFL